MREVYGGVEGGGTKFKMVLGNGPGDIVDESLIPTTTPEETIGRVIEFFRRPRPEVTLKALGIASFGPLDLDPDSPTYGFITATTKRGWSNTEVVGSMRSALGVPVGWDTDVAGAATGEYVWGAGRGARMLVYVTVGTGIGAAALLDGKPAHGMLHPEMGHILVPSFPGDIFGGVCPFHGRCLEGLASGPALRARLGRPAEEISADDPVWDLEAFYLAAGVHSIGYVLSPDRVILGGGVGGTPGLLERVRQRVLILNGAYRGHPESERDAESYIVPPGLGSESGVLGALIVARAAAGDR
jgi:fructokinase